MQLVAIGGHTVNVFRNIFHVMAAYLVGETESLSQIQLYSIQMRRRGGGGILLLSDAACVRVLSSWYLYNYVNSFGLSWEEEPLIMIYRQYKFKDHWRVHFYVERLISELPSYSSCAGAVLQSTCVYGR